jgi:hypothetical protein
MERVLGRAHRWVGLITVLVFLGTGVIMRRQHLELLPADSSLRLLFRSRHIYLLFSGLLNLVVGLRFVLPSVGRGRHVAPIGSALILLSPVLLLAAFFLEPMGSKNIGPVSAYGVFASFLGVLFYSIGSWRRQAG